MRSNTLHYFSEVARHGSFRAAADALHIAASAVNRQISNLEVGLGVKLFERTRGRGGLQLTEAGRILQRRLHSAANELRIAGDEITALQGLKFGHVAIGANEGIAGTMLPDVISAFQKLHPNITFSVDMDRTQRLAVRLKNSEIDFAVGYDFPADEDLFFLKALSLKPYAVVSADHALASRPFVSLADLGSSGLIVAEGAAPLRHAVDPATGGSSGPISSVVETNSMELIYSLVERGAEAGIMTGRASDREGRGQLVHIEIDDALLPHRVVACCKMPDRSLSAAAEAFAGAVCEALDRWAS